MSGFSALRREDRVYSGKDQMWTFWGSIEIEIESVST